MLCMPAVAQDLGKGAEAYDNGDYATALREFRPLADQGTALAQFNLGFMYEYGDGVPQDLVEAHKWYNLSASRGDTLAVENRDLIAEKMTPADISKAQSLAREWLEKHPR